MALTGKFRGFAGDGLKLDSLWWPRYEWQSHLLAGGKHGVSSGGTVTATGTRGLTATALEALPAPGVVLYADAAETATGPVNTTGVTRRDYLCLVSDWTAETVTLQVVTGGSILPSLVQTPGMLWQEPLARANLANGGTSYTSIEECKPLPLKERPLTVTLTTGQTAAYTSSGVTIGTAAFTDPGWPYRIEVDAQLRFQPSNGYGVLAAIVNGITLPTTHSVTLTAGGAVPSRLVARSAAIAGAPAAVTLRMIPASMTSGNALTINDTPAVLYVKQVPA